MAKKITKKQDGKKRVLVLIPTNEDKKYCVGKFLTHLKKIQTSGKDFEADFLFTDDSRDKAYHEESFARFGYEIIRVGDTVDKFAQGKSVEIRQCLCNARSLLRQEFRKRTKYTHALYLDSDILPPLDVIPRLLEWNKDIVSGLYWQKSVRENVNGKEFVDDSPVCFKYQDVETCEMGLANLGSTLVPEEIRPSRLLGDLGDYVQITAIGTGCLMLSRKAMEDNWAFRWDVTTKATEDMHFSIDIKKLGYPIYADSHVLCRHYNRPWKTQMR